MKTQLLQSVCFTFPYILLQLVQAVHASTAPADSVLFCGVNHEQWRRDHPRPAAKRPADLNAGEPRTVRMIYFLPNDRQPRTDIDATFDTLIRVVRQSYAEQMESHGFGRRTFRFETDGDGKALVHHVEGEYDDVHYHTDSFGKVWEETVERFDLRANIYLVVLDIGDTLLDSGICGAVSGRLVVIPCSIFKNEHAWNCGNVAVIAHELGHAFGIDHDSFRNATRSPSSYHTDMMVTSFCAAEWLDAHRYFNLGRKYPEINQKTTIRMLPPRAVPPNALNLRFEVTDPDGLHQAQLRSSYYGVVVGCQKISGVQATIEFVTHQVLKDAALRVVDADGNYTYREFPIDINTLLSSEIVLIPDANLAAVVRETLRLPPGNTITQLDMLRLRHLQASFRQITDLTGLEHAVNLTELQLAGNQIRDVRPLAGLTILVVLELFDNSISDISPLNRLNNLERLRLGRNSISDLSPLAGLTNLKVIRLAGNPIASTAPLRGLFRRNPFLEADFDSHTLEIISGDGQQGASGEALAQLLVVEVRDHYGNPLADATVNFTVTAGDGSLSATFATTDENGRASVALTLGSQPGTNSVVATIANFNPVTFTAIAYDRADFDGDGTVGFGDFVQFAGKFGLSRSDEGYDTRFDLDGNGAIGFSDFLIFAGAFGKG